MTIFFEKVSANLEMTVSSHLGSFLLGEGREFTALIPNTHSLSD